ncbi:hypothetical protein PIB30_014891 [Stylosanthes scabra]|uniref:Transposase MuDR plant domain-containing protein n=1 Tax=Stylosanthes scabra TaxID=79078 RepID=A0ABU6T8K5_9FABA|nr:hypothetical protein [Stylosanthes scabra]
MNVNNFVVVTVYPNGEMGRDRYGIWFRSSTPVVYPVVTLEELKSVILRNMGLRAVGTSLVRRVAYRLLNVFPPDPFKFKIFWVDSNEHVRALFDLHRRYETREVMELLMEMQSMPKVDGGSSSSNGVIPCSPINCPAPEVPMLTDANSGEDSNEEFVPDVEESSESLDGSEFVPESQSRTGFFPAPAPIPDLSSVNSHFHTLHLEDMDEESMEGFGEGGDYYDVDGGEEFRVGHRFSKREAVYLGVKNYNIKRASEYRVVESDPYKYVCRCKRGEVGCPCVSGSASAGMCYNLFRSHTILIANDSSGVLGGITGRAPRYCSTMSHGCC